jgi:hypothetical protein
VPSTEGFTCAGTVGNAGLNLSPKALPPGRQRNKYGSGPFARLKMPDLPEKSGLYLWQVGTELVYVGQTRTPLRERLGSRGYSTISNYNTFAREPGRRNGGQETNSRINALANKALGSGLELRIWFKVVDAGLAKTEEARWMVENGIPAWNRRDERDHASNSLLVSSALPGNTIPIGQRDR